MGRMIWMKTRTQIKNGERDNGENYKDIRLGEASKSNQPNTGSEKVKADYEEINKLIALADHHEITENGIWERVIFLNLEQLQARQKTAFDQAQKDVTNKQFKDFIETNFEQFLDQNIPKEDDKKSIKSKLEQHVNGLLSRISSTCTGEADSISLSNQLTLDLQSINYKSGSDGKDCFFRDTRLSGTDLANSVIR